MSKQSILIFGTRITCGVWLEGLSLSLFPVSSWLASCFYSKNNSSQHVAHMLHLSTCLLLLAVSHRHVAFAMLRLLFRRSIFLLLSLCCFILFLVTVKQCCQFVGSQTPVIRPLEMSSKELFAKRARENKPT